MNNTIIRNNVKTLGNPSNPTLILAHGFGCDQNMWRFMLPALQESFYLLLFDYVGSGQSKLADYTTEKYSSLDGYAQDIIDIIEALELHDVTIVGHSVSATVAGLVSLQLPEVVKKIIMI